MIQATPFFNKVDKAQHSFKEHQAASIVILMRRYTQQHKCRNARTLKAICVGVESTQEEESDECFQVHLS